MMGQYIADQVAAAMAEHGETMTLARPASEGTTITLKGKRIGGALEGLGNTDQRTFRVKIATAELAASSWSSKIPAAGDLLTIEGRVCNVLYAIPRRDGDVVALYELEVAG